MPVMNGIEAAYELKRIMPNVPIILFTVHAITMKYALGRSSPIDLIVAKSDAVHILGHIRSLEKSQQHPQQANGRAQQ
jgi:CheY-like chemotaxis protein